MVAAWVTKAPLTTSSVYPSGADLATNSFAMIDPAPVRFSGSTCCERPSPIFCAMIRPTTSTLPPGGKPTSSRTGFAG